MSLGNYGTVRSADVNVDDIEIYYTFSPNRQTKATTVNLLDPAQVLTKLLLPTAQQVLNQENLLEGLYDLTLPSATFNQIGIYNIFIKPKTYRVKIVDCGVLAALPSIKGILLDSTAIDSKLIANNSLQGYRVEYLNDGGNKIRNTFRIVTTSNKVIPVTENIGNTSQTATRYRFDDSGNLIFCQLTPSSSSNVKPNLIPFIGTANQNILLSNTFFNPVCIEVELAENTIDTVIDYVGGEQLRDSDNGIVTNFNKNRDIIAQFNVFSLKDEIGNDKYEIKERRGNIDSSQNLDDILNEIQ